MAAARRALPLLLLLAAVPAGAVGPKGFLLHTGLRHDSFDLGRQRSRLEGQIRLGVTLDLGRETDLVALAATGPNYTTRWSVLKDLKTGGVSDLDLRFRHLYLQRRFGETRVQAGAIPPVKNRASSTGLEALGWIDGARVERRFGDLTVEAVAGGLLEPDNPDVLTRRKALNYFELELTHAPLADVVAEGSFERLDRDDFARGEVRWMPGGGLGRSLEVSAEGLYNTDQRSFGWQLGARGRLAGARVYVAHSYIGSGMGLRGRLSEDFFAFGPKTHVELRGELFKDGPYGWSLRGMFARPAARLTAGLSMSLSR